MIDSHCHLDFPAFDHDREAVLARCGNLGITDILIPGTEQRRWLKQIAMCRQYPQLHCALGIHPYFLDTFDALHIDQLASLLSSSRNDVIALGEIGLDFSLETDKTLQLDVLHAQLALAKQHDLPVILHHRKSHNELIRALKQADLRKGGVVHAFSGSQQEAFQYLDKGFLLGAGGTITYERAVKTRNTFATIPDTGFLLETDAPDMPLSGRQGQRNSPECVVEVAETLAEIRASSTTDVARQATRNFQSLFAVCATDNSAF